MIRELRNRSRGELRELLARGHPITASSLEGADYGGVSLGLPDLALRLLWTKFQKVFRRDAESGRLRGWNRRVQQNRLEEPWIPLSDRKPFGYFEVVRDPAGPGLLLDYGAGPRGRWTPLAPLRDPLVALRPGDPTWLLGRSDIALGPLRVPTPTYFLLARL